MALRDGIFGGTHYNRLDPYIHIQNSIAWQMLHNINKSIVFQVCYTIVFVCRQLQHHSMVTYLVKTVPPVTAAKLILHFQHGGLDNYILEFIVSSWKNVYSYRV